MATEVEDSPGLLAFPTPELTLEDKTATMAIKQILTQLQGAFPMDKADIDGPMNILEYLYLCLLLLQRCQQEALLSLSRTSGLALGRPQADS